MRRLAALLTAAALTLAACGSDPADTAAAGDLPTVSGEPGDKPTVEVPDAEPADQLEVEVLAEGEGAEVTEGDFVVAHYLGQTWEPGESGAVNVFDNSYDRGQPAGFVIGAGKVIDGWDEGLVGRQVGSRVLLVIPPEQGYGAEGTPDGAIPGDSTLVFVVDIVDAVPAGATVSGTPVTGLPAGLPQVTDNGPQPPTVTIPAGSAAPAQSTSTVLVAGDGEPLSDLLVAKVLQVAYPAGETTYSSWDEGPSLLSPEQLPGLPEALAGQKVGTRVLVQVAAADNPGAEGSAGTALALVVDIIGTV